MDRLLQQKQILEGLLTENPSVGVVISSHHNMDVVAAGLSLQLIFQDSGKTSQIVSAKEPIVEYSSLVGIDQIGKNFSGVTKTLTVSFPYKEGEIEKVSYNIEGDRLNVNLFGEEGGINIQEKDIKYIRQGSSPNLLFTIGARDLTEIQDYAQTGAKIVNIDNDVANTLFGDVVLVDASFSSISEIIAKLAQMLNLQVEFDVAQNLLDGISFATQNYSSPKTSPIAFEAASMLLQRGAVRRNVKDMRPQSSDTSLQQLPKNQGKQMGGLKNLPKQFEEVSKPFTQNPSFNNSYTQQNTSYQNTMQPQSMAREEFADEEVSTPPVRAQAASVSRPNIPTPETFPMDDSVDSVTQPAENIPTEEEAPSDWFVPKVFKSTKNQG